MHANMAQCVCIVEKTLAVTEAYGGSIFHAADCCVSSDLLKMRFGALAPFSLQATRCEFTANTDSFILLMVRNACAGPVEHADLVTVSSIS